MEITQRRRKCEKNQISLDSSTDRNDTTPTKGELMEVDQDLEDNVNKLNRLLRDQ